MGPGRFTHLPPRIWTVSIRACHGATIAECRTCGPVEDSPAHDPRLRHVALGHLARHARCDLTPAHLRTCQCGRRGCPWHRRRRGCSGPVLLALTLDTPSRTWRLTDLCHRCYQAIPGTVTVPRTANRTRGADSGRVGDRGSQQEEDPLIWDVCPSCSTTECTCYGATSAS